VRCNLITFLLLSLFLCVGERAYALDCSLLARLNFPDVAGHSGFWDDFAKIDNIDDDQLKKLFAEHGFGPDKPGQSLIPNINLNPQYFMSNKIKKNLDILPANLRKNFDEFVNQVNAKGYKSLYLEPGKWHYEQLKGSKNHTIRLSGGYRVEFIDRDGIPEIIGVGKDVGGH
jgi:hypothetical protein